MWRLLLLTVCKCFQTSSAELLLSAFCLWPDQVFLIKSVHVSFFYHMSSLWLYQYQSATISFTAVVSCFVIWVNAQTIKVCHLYFIYLFLFMYIFYLYIYLFIFLHYFLSLFSWLVIFLRIMTYENRDNYFWFEDCNL